MEAFVILSTNFHSHDSFENIVFLFTNVFLLTFCKMIHMIDSPLDDLCRANGELTYEKKKLISQFPPNSNKNSIFPRVFHIKMAHDF